MGWPKSGDIMLSEQAEPVYETTNNYEIILSFKEAGNLYVKVNV